jgi:hypothetical protein
MLIFFRQDRKDRCVARANNWVRAARVLDAGCSPMVVWGTPEGAIKALLFEGLAILPLTS